ncbi:conserved hypothetical protein [Prochlorococcus marinus str. MIT 9515]|uniref:Nuclease n=1 Tax=Prochlorococcus marinus (strain MIT 9515) TaxID=167542 RepID=A2BVI9_PROM5|nr:hypothetical protein [Prochlorococcus marinus]ABM71800.1 conserved hypothetical protein [Prochlorococcus marinus str. MIT 9515]
MKKVISILIIFVLVIFFPIRTYSAEILQINSSSNILVGDQNRDLPIKLFCVEINDKDNEQIAINLLKKEFPRGSKVKIKPLGFKENILLARVFDINETKEMSELLFAKDLLKENCQN